MNRSVSNLCGRPQRARCGGSADPRQCKQHHTISTNWSTAEPADGIRAGAPRVFPRWYECPLTGLLYIILTANARLWFLQCVSHELINTLRPGQDGRHFGRSHLKVHFLEWKFLNFNQIFTEICYLRSNWPYGNISSENVLAPNRQKAIILSKVGMLCWRIYASPGFNELICNL